MSTLPVIFRVLDARVGPRHSCVDGNTVALQCEVHGGKKLWLVFDRDLALTVGGDLETAYQQSSGGVPPPSATGEKS